MNSDTDLSIVIKARNEAASVIEQVKSQASSLGGSLKDGFDAAVPASKALLASVAALGAGVVAFGVESVKAYEDSQNVQAQLTSAIKSTSGAAGQTLTALNAQSHALQEQTRYSDEAVGSAQAMLLTFTGISGKTFPEATKTTLDMATALGMNATDAALQLGKALNDPATGMTKLQRVGVTFTQAQQDQITAMTQAGNVAGAQAVILKELQREFGGSAEAAGGTFAGSLDKLKNNFNDLQETLGKTIIDALLPLTTAFANWSARISDAGGFIAYFQSIFEAHHQVILAIAGAITVALLPAVIELAAGFIAMAAPILPFLAVGAILGVLVDKLVDKFGGWHKVLQDIKPYIDDVGTAIKVLYTGLSGGDATMTGAGRSWDKFGNTVMGVHDFLMNLGKDIEATLLTAWHLLGDAVQGLLPSLEALGSTIADRLWPAIQHLWQALNPALIDALKILAVVIGVTIYAAIWLAINVLNILISTMSWLGQIVANVAGFIGVAVMGIIHWFETAVATIVADWQQWQLNIQAIVSAVAGFFSGLWADIVGAAGLAWAIIKGGAQDVGNFFAGVFRGAYNAVTGVFGGLWGFFQGVWNNIVGLFGKVGTSVGNAIGDAFKGVINDVLNGAVSVINGFIGAIDGAINVINKLPGVNLGKISKLNVPQLAEGGIVTGATTAVIGEGREPEAVIPLSKIQAVAAAQRGDNGAAPAAGNTIQVTVSIGNYISNPSTMRDLSVELAKYLQQALQAQGVGDVNQLRAT